MRVLMHPVRQSEVLAIEGRRSFTVGNGQGDMVQREHTAFYAAHPTKANEASGKDASQQEYAEREGRYSMILLTTPAPTVRPPSRMAKRSLSSMAIGAISVTLNLRLSPGITISVPSGSSTVPVTSVVRK
jgi:hypothetical protein